jgi:hypothetical protein
MGKLLEFALADPSPAVRAVAIRHAFIHWRREREAGLQLLEDLMDRSIGSLGLPIPHMFESSVGLSLMILFDDFKNVETTARLRRIWRRAIEQLLRVNPKQLGSRSEQVKGWIRTALLQIATGFAVRTASEVQSNSLLSIPELKQFFKRDGTLERRRAVARKLVKYMDIEKTDVRDIRDDLLALVAERDIFITLFAFIVLHRHTLVHNEMTLPMMKELFGHAIEVDPIGPFATVVSLAMDLRKEFVTEESRALFLHMVTTYLDRFQGIWWSNLGSRRFTNLDTICFAEAGDDADVPITPIARRYVEKMIENSDYDWISDIIKWDVTNRAVQADGLRFAFSVLEMLVDLKEPPASVREALIDLLARIRVYHQDQVDDFIEVNSLDEQFTTAIRTHASSETLGDMVDLRGLIFWNEAIMLEGSPELWQKLIWLFGQLPECRSLGQWLTVLFKTAINLIYGGPVFVDAPA